MAIDIVYRLQCKSTLTLASVTLWHFGRWLRNALENIWSGKFKELWGNNAKTSRFCHSFENMWGYLQIIYFPKRLKWAPSISVSWDFLYLCCQTAPFWRHHAKKNSFFYIFFSGFVFRGVSGIFLILSNLCRHLSYNSCSGGQADKKESLIKAQTLSKKGNDQIKNFHSPKIKNSLELKQCDWKPPLVVFNWLWKSVKRWSCK